MTTLWDKISTVFEKSIGKNVDNRHFVLFLQCFERPSIGQGHYNWGVSTLLIQFVVLKTLRQKVLENVVEKGENAAIQNFFYQYVDKQNHLQNI